MKAFAALLVLLSALCAAAPAFGQSVERKALVALCDPAKIATLKSDRAANPRIRKITYWLEVTRMNGNSPAAVVDVKWSFDVVAVLALASTDVQNLLAESKPLGRVNLVGVFHARTGF